MNSLRNRLLLILGLTLLSLYGVAPTIVYFSLPKEVRNDPEELKKRLPSWLPQKHIKLGLDLQGGVQLVLGVDTQVAVDNKLGRVGTELSRWANESTKRVKAAYTAKGEQTLRVELEEGVDVDDFKSEMTKEFTGLKEVRREGSFIDFQYDDEQLTSIRDAALAQAERVVRSRIDKWGVSEPSINRRADKSILVQLPGFKDPEKARELLGRTAQLKFKLEDEDSKAFDPLIKGLPPQITYERAGNYNAISFISEDKQAIIDLTKGHIPEGRELLFEEEQIAGGKKRRYTSHLLMASTELSGEDVLDAQVTYDSGSFDNRPAVSLKLTGVGGKRFADITGENINKRLAIVLDDVVVSDPVINSRIPGGEAQITLGAGKPFDEQVEEANQLSLILKSGALPAPITIMEERQVGATLGPELANQGVTSVLMGIALVFVFMLVYYRRTGAIACLALALNGLFLLVLMAGFGFSLTLPGFAGFILTLGMAVDANVLINERIRQELNEGKPAKKAVDVAFQKVFWTIIDANITTLIAALVLLETNASGPIKGFAVALILGLLVSLFTSLFCSKTFFTWVTGLNKPEGVLRNWLGAKAASGKVPFHFDFLKFGKLATIIGAALCVLVVAVGGARGINWSVDFAGGTEMEVLFKEAVPADTIRGVLKKAGVQSASLQGVGDKRGQQYIIRYEQKSGGTAAESTEEFKNVREVLNTELGQYGLDIQRVDFVGPLIGKELRKQGALSVIWAILGILVYIGLRFDMRFGPGAVLKMVQDVFVIMGFYIFFYRSFDLTSVAALLTVVGYSVNDTIVIYDRIRENLQINPRRALYENINFSLNETLSRSINTSITTIISLVGVLVFTSAQIWNFAAAMTLGVVSATLTSTFLATTLLLWFENFRRNRGQKLA